MIPKLTRRNKTKNRIIIGCFVALTIIAGLIYVFVFQDPGESAPNVSQKEITNASDKKAPILAKDILFKNQNEESGNLTSADAIKLKYIYKNRPDDPLGAQLKMSKEFYKNAFDILKNNKPSVEPLDKYESDERIYHAGYDGVGDSPTLTIEYLKTFLKLSEEDVTSMKNSHNEVIKNLPDDVPPGLYKGNGIVYVGGGTFNWLILLSIKTLRSLGSRMPVEVLMPSLNEYELEICSDIFPALNAKCIYLPKILGDEVANQFLFKGYQYKSLAIILSSFENVLFLDADNIPTKKPDFLFNTKPFTTHGLIVWPDFWKRATSPYFYDIVDIKLDPNARTAFGVSQYGNKVIPNIQPNSGIPLHQLKGAIPDPTSESGQIMFSKSMHIKTLYLALYYNLYGPDYFYKLFSQGSDGEGDKETFIAAAVVLKKPFYQVKKLVKSLGRFQHGEYIGSAMAQFDPAEDYDIWQRNLNNNEDVTESPDILFIHSNFPKLDPWKLREEGAIYSYESIQRNRLYGTGLIDLVHFDFELLQWKNMKFFLCDLDLDLECFQELNNKDICAEINEQLDYLLMTTHK